MRWSPKARLYQMNLKNKPLILWLRISVMHPQLAHPKPNRINYQLVTDSSNYIESATLNQIEEGNPILIGSFLKKLIQASSKYSTFWPGTLGTAYL